MANVKQRAERFTLLSTVQSAEVARASERYRMSLSGLEQANEKLRSLEDYFSAGPDHKAEYISSMGLQEASVFSQRLQKAIAAQREICDQLASQSEAARSLLMQAELRRVGFDKAKVAAHRQLQAEQNHREQRRTEDNLMARYRGHRP
mgnify:CR=1 FL=1